MARRAATQRGPSSSGMARSTKTASKSCRHRPGYPPPAGGTPAPPPVPRPMPGARPGAWLANAELPPFEPVGPFAVAALAPVVLAAAVAVARAAAAAAAAASCGPKYLRLAAIRRWYFLIASAPWIA